MNKGKLNGIPKYLEVYQRLKADILSRKYPLGTLLPTENELVEMFGVSKITVRHAVQLLREEHLVNVQQGRGAEVILPQTGIEHSSHHYRNATSISVRYRADSLGEFRVSVPYVDRIAADLKVSGGLEVPVGTEVIRIQRTHAIGDQVIGYIVHYVPKDLAPELVSGKLMGETSLYQYLEQNHGVRFLEGSESIDIASAGFAESKVLDVEVGAPLFLLTRRAWSENGIMEYCESLFKPHNFEIQVAMKGGE